MSGEHKGKRQFYFFKALYESQFKIVEKRCASADGKCINHIAIVMVENSRCNNLEVRQINLKNDMEYRYDSKVNRQT